MKNTLSAFLDGFSGGSLLAWTTLPDSPTQVFADDGSNRPQEELVKSLLRIQENEGEQAETVVIGDIHGRAGDQLLSLAASASVEEVDEQADVRRSSTSSLAKALSAEIGAKRAARVLRRALVEVEKEMHGA